MATKKLTVKELIQKMSTGAISSQSMLKEALTNIDNNIDHNAFITIDREGALSKAIQYDKLREMGELIGPLHGILVAVKDNIHVAGLPNTAGTLALKNFIPKEDAIVVKRLKEAGAIVIGKTNMHELAYGVTSDNKTFGAVGNSKSGAFIAGGSSGGTGTAVALNMASIGIGTDTGGSARIPSALNGIVGFRPTTDRYPTDGMTRISSTRDTVGPMVSSVEDCQLLDEILSGEKNNYQEMTLKGLRIGVPREYFYENLEPLIAEKTEHLLKQIKQAGAELVFENLNNVGEMSGDVGFPIVIYETNELLTSYLESNVPSETLRTLIEKISDSSVKEIMEMVLNKTISKELYKYVIDTHRPNLQQLYRSYFSQHSIDAIIFPTTPLTARPIEGSEVNVELNGSQVPTFKTYIQNTDPGSNAGIPGLSIPLSVTDNGLPFGIEIDGPENTDHKLLAIGLAIEKLINSESC